MDQAQHTWRSRSPKLVNTSICKPRAGTRAVGTLLQLTARTWLKILKNSLYLKDARQIQDYPDLSRLWLSQAENPSPSLRQLLRPQAALCLVRLFRLRPTLEALDRACIPWLFLKGAALNATEVYPVGVRQMSDIDILVPPERFLESWRLLGQLGWKSSQGSAKQNWENFEYQDHSLDLTHPEQGNLDLHWSAVNEGRRPGCDDGLWLRCRSATLVGMRCSVPCPTDLLMTICVHGYRCGGSSPRWTNDGIALLNSQHNFIEWETLLSEARARQLELPLLATLSWLHTEGAPVPTAALQALQGRLLPFWQALDFWVRSRRSSRFKRAALVCLDYIRCCPGQHTPGFFQFLRRRWQR